MAVVEAVAEREDVDPIALTPPLHESIDPEALDTLFGSGSQEANQNAELAIFTYHGYTVTVSYNGHVTLNEQRGKEPLSIFKNSCKEHNS